MKQVIKHVKLATVLVSLCSTLTCVNENPVQHEKSATWIIQPVCALEKGMDVNEVDSAVAVVIGDGIKDSIVFELKVDLLSNPKKLYGTFELPMNGKNWIAIVRMYDSKKRKIGEGYLQFDDSYFKVGKYTANVTIGINSAKPNIDTCTAETLFVGINDTIKLHAVARDNDSNGVIEKYEWKFAENEWIQTSTADTNIFAPDSSQIYVCKIRATDNDNNVVSDSVAITVETRPPTAHAGNDTTVGINDTINLHGNGYDETEIVKYEWKCGDGKWKTTINGDTVIIAPATEQTYICSLRVTDDDGNISTDAIAATIEKRAPFAFAGKDTTVGLNDLVYLSAQGSRDETKITTYEWKCGDGDWIDVLNGDTAVSAPSTAQAWACSLKVTDNEGNTCYDLKVITVSVYPPIANAGNDTTVSINDIIKLHGTGTDETGIVKYEWKFGDGEWIKTSNGDTNIVAPKTAQTYVCSLKVTDDDSSTDISTLIVKVLSDVPIIESLVKIPSVPFISIYDTVTIAESTINQFGKYTRKWIINDDVIPDTGSKITVIADSSAVVLLCTLIVTDDDGLKDTLSTSIDVRKCPPVAKISTNHDSITSGEQITLSTNGTQDSSNSHGNISSYAIKILPVSDELVNFSGKDTTITIPSEFDSIVAILFVTDDDGQNASDSVTIFVWHKDIFVDSAAAGENNGRTWKNAYFNLQDALQKARNGTSIHIAEGTYYPAGIEGNNREESFFLKNGIRIYGGYQRGGIKRGDNYITILSGDIQKDGDPSNNVFSVIRSDKLLALQRHLCNIGSIYFMNTSSTMR